MPVDLPQTGLASWYADGTNADDSDVNNSIDMTAAHRDLPLGLLVKVTRLSNGFHCVVKITDRGPYEGDRILDLRPAAARALGFGPTYGNDDPGIVRVKIEAIGGSR